MGGGVQAAPRPTLYSRRSSGHSNRSGRPGISRWVRGHGGYQCTCEVCEPHYSVSMSCSGKRRRWGELYCSWWNMSRTANLPTTLCLPAPHTLLFFHRFVPLPRYRLVLSWGADPQRARRLTGRGHHCKVGRVLGVGVGGGQEAESFLCSLNVRPYLAPFASVLHVQSPPRVTEYSASIKVWTRRVVCVRVKAGIP